MPVNVLETLADYETAIKSDSLTVVDFWATWCGPCIRIAPAFKELAEANPDVNFCKVDVDDNDEAAGAAGIKCMPTFKFFKGGNCVDTLEGANKEAIVNMINKHK